MRTGYFTWIVGAALLFDAEAAFSSAAQVQGTATERQRDERMREEMKVQVPTAEAQRARAARSTVGASEFPGGTTLHTADAPSLVETQLGPSLLKNLALDQRAIWTSPARLRWEDADWLVPLGGLAAGLKVTDRESSAHLSQDPNTLRRYRTISNAGTAALLGAAGGLTLWGLKSHDDHRRETGLLAGEAVLDSLAVVSALKYTTQRRRPLSGDGRGQFFGGGDSFPSEHAAAAWAAASVIAHEYPGPLTRLLVYGTATAVSFSRVRSREHFASDVLVGSVLGQLVAHQVYRRHHDPELGGGEWKSIGEIVRGEGSSSPANQGSPYVPLDSWIYPALDRLAALGVIDSGFAGLRPWTRRECARLLGETADRADRDAAGGAEAEETYRLLETQFRNEMESAGGAETFRVRVESVYARVAGISGKPLTDGFHFGQTITNDYGRPYQEGINSVAGFSAWTTSGRWVGYVRAEYQHAPSAPALADAARQTIAAVDAIPAIPPATPFASVNRVQLLDAYAGLNFEDWQVTFGKQSLWWGPGDGESMMFSDNAEPINMFRINRISPFQLPSILKLFGPMRVEFFVGQLEGHHFVNGPSGTTGSWSEPLNPPPFINGLKFSFKPTPNLEVGVSATTVFSGSGVPFTGHKFLQSLFSGGNGPPGSASDPGDRRSGLDFSYRIPKFRRWLTLYGDGFADDQIIFDPSQIPPRRSVWSAGIHVPMFPGVPKLELQVEGGYTDHPRGGYLSHGFFYWNSRYLNGYTNNGNLLGSWMGRQGQGAQVRLTYWLSPRSRVQSFYRHLKVSQQFIRSGGTLSDVGFRGEYWSSSGVGVSAWMQAERWLFPVIQPNASRNVTAAVQVSFEPQRLFKHSAADQTENAPTVGGRP